MSYINHNTIRPRLVCSLLLCFCFVSSAVADQPEASRLIYQKALKQLNDNNLNEYDRLKAQLTQYPLYPYLEQQELTHRFDQISQQRIDRYATQYAALPTVYPLEQKWLNYLASKQRWQDYIAAYRGSKVRSELAQCHYRNALLQTDQPTQALNAIDTLWNAGHSIVSACDPVFNYWFAQQQGPSSSLAYQRFWKAVDNNNLRLAVYLQRYINDAAQTAAIERFQRVRKQPALIKDPNYFPGDTIASQITYLYGIDRLSRKSPQAAAEAWFNIRTQRSFSEAQQQTLNRTLARRLANRPDKQTDTLLSQLNIFQDEQIQARRIKLALTALNWNKVHQLIDEMPVEMQQDERWIYWKTLSASHIKGLQPAYSDAFVKLSTQRSYYGLLAARTLKTGFHLNPQQDKVVETAVLQLASSPAMRRMHELYQLDQRYLARREWNQLTRDYDADQLRTAATVLHRWGWHNMAIIGIAKAKYWDDITLRFPMPYSDTFATLAGKFNIDTNWARAIARQESAYQPHARSRVGARGLMQLMPKTAKMTAKHNNIPYKAVSDLYQPNTNINLGVAYLAEMQKKFDNNQVYATAAYNAGPSRVNRWLKQRGELPIDIWIETIPFTETRRYVMNVMAYHAVYRTLAGKPVHLPEAQTAFRVALQSSTGADQAEQLRDFIRHNRH
ncbi:transglycosylase SLT domain-containing protein [Amphritea sp. 1_MG-2023]|uniref:transglycosylase SLT domain-containing protein n=1 Tax=Amphritea sp. 1_MG-2023 TaxID=3062670 RepID=UPI0026E3EBFA|nr:transglycosylase SLT domain-containing protein [Amphritea sp. 1_MG-2023]MDO6563476.1 transglycosylase SLT domain-containing protein [Amphritea sp. 1_MG-2023]